MSDVLRRGVVPPVGSVWWTDGYHVLPLSEAEILGWLARGVSVGWVVAADTPERALVIGGKLHNQTLRAML